MPRPWTDASHLRDALDAAMGGDFARVRRFSDLKHAQQASHVRTFSDALSVLSGGDEEALFQWFLRTADTKRGEAAKHRVVAQKIRSLLTDSSTGNSTRLVRAAGELFCNSCENEARRALASLFVNDFTWEALRNNFGWNDLSKRMFTCVRKNGAHLDSPLRGPGRPRLSAEVLSEIARCWEAKSTPARGSPFGGYVDSVKQRPPRLCT